MKALLLGFHMPYRMWTFLVCEKTREKIYIGPILSTGPIFSTPSPIPPRGNIRDTRSESGRDFGLWSFRFPLVLVRAGRRLPVQALGERRVLVAVTGYPRGGAPGPGAVPGLPEIKEKSGIFRNRSQ